MNLNELPKDKLENLIFDACAELHNRRLQDNKDPFAVIKGHEAAKRAISVACCGNPFGTSLPHKILFVGPPGCGKTMLCSAAGKVNVPAFEMYPCPCGYFKSPLNQCKCSPNKIEKYWLSAKAIKTLKTVDMMMHINYVPAREMESKIIGTNLETILDIRKRHYEFVKSGRAQTDPSILDEVSRMLIKQFHVELGASWEIIDKAKNVAVTIAGMDQSDKIQAHHISEALMYAPTIRRI